MIKYFCNYCNEEITDTKDLMRLTSQNPAGEKVGYHFHCNCYKQWLKNAFSTADNAEPKKRGPKPKVKEENKETEVASEHLDLNGYEWDVMSYKVTGRTTRTLDQTRRILINVYMYGNQVAADRTGNPVYTINNVVSRYGQKQIKEFLKDDDESDGFQVGDIIVDHLQLLALYSNNWEVSDIADEMKIDKDTIERVIEVFSGLASEE